MLRYIILLVSLSFYSAASLTAALDDPDGDKEVDRRDPKRQRREDEPQYPVIDLKTKPGNGMIFGFKHNGWYREFDGLRFLTFLDTTVYKDLLKFLLPRYLTKTKTNAKNSQSLEKPRLLQLVKDLFPLLADHPQYTLIKLKNMEEHGNVDFSLLSGFIAREKKRELTSQQMASLMAQIAMADPNVLVSNRFYQNLLQSKPDLTLQNDNAKLDLKLNRLNYTMGTCTLTYNGTVIKFPLLNFFSFAWEKNPIEVPKILLAFRYLNFCTLENMKKNQKPLIRDVIERLISGDLSTIRLGVESEIYNEETAISVLKNFEIDNKTVKVGDFKKLLSIIPSYKQCIFMPIAPKNNMPESQEMSFVQNDPISDQLMLEELENLEKALQDLDLQFSDVAADRRKRSSYNKEVIKRRYKDLWMKNHPDRNPDGHEKTQTINGAIKEIKRILGNWEK